jgi:hypothetical protein
MRNMTTQGRGMQRSARQQLKLGKLVGRQSKGCEKGKMSATSEQQLETTVTHFVLRTLSTHTQNAPCTHTHLVHTHLVHTHSHPRAHTHMHTHTQHAHMHIHTPRHTCRPGIALAIQPRPWAKRTYREPARV